MFMECRKDHKCGALATRVKSSSMRLYNSVSCTPVGTAGRCGSSNWAPQSFLPEPMKTAGQRMHSSPRQSRQPKTTGRRTHSPPSQGRQPNSPSRETRTKKSERQEGASTQPSPQSKNSDVTETTKATAPVGGSFDSFHFDINMLRNQSSASTSYSDPSLYAMSSSSTWTTNTSLFRGQYEPFEEGSEKKKGYIELHKLASSEQVRCEPPALVKTPILQSSHTSGPKDIRKLTSSGFHKALEGRNLTPHSRRTRKTRAASQRNNFSISKKKTASGTGSLKRFDDASLQTLSSFREFVSTAEAFSSNDDGRIFTSEHQGGSVANQECSFRPYGDKWSSFEYFETDDSSDFLNEFSGWGEVVRSSPFTPIERPPPAQLTELIAPLPCTPNGSSSGASSSIESETSKTPSSFSVRMRRSGRSYQRHDHLDVPQIGEQPLFRSFPMNHITQKHLSSRTRLLEATSSTFFQRGSSSLSVSPANDERAKIPAPNDRKHTASTTTGPPIPDADDSIMARSLDAASLHRTALYNQRSLSKRRPGSSSFRRIRAFRIPQENRHPGTVWAMLENDMNAGTLNVDFSESEFLSLFRADEFAGMQRRGVSTAFAEDCSSVIDPKRANDGSKILATIDMKFENIASAIENLEVNAMNLDQLTRILPYIPTPEERSALVAFVGSNSTPLKTECENFMVSMLVVHDAKRKLEAMIFMKIFGDCMESIRNDAVALQTACKELIRDSGFRKILGIILTLGNRLNLDGTNQDVPARAIKVESLLELAKKKTPSGEVTILEWIARVVVKYYPHLVDFMENLSGLHRAENINWESSITEFEEFELQLYELRWLALGHGGKSDEDEEPCLTIPEEIERLRSSTVGIFTLGACVRMATVADEIEQAQSALATLVQYFGEDDWHAQPHELLRLVAAFCIRFDAALQSAKNTDGSNETSVTNGLEQSHVKNDDGVAETVMEIYQTLGATAR